MKRLIVLALIVVAGCGGPAKPWSQLTGSEQADRVADCFMRVGSAQLEGKFDGEIDGRAWCYAHAADDPASWPKP